MQALKGLPARILVIVLLLQTAAYYAVASRSERIPTTTPLKFFPPGSGGWTVGQEYPLEKEVQEVLRADDTMNRLYWNPSHTARAYLFVAFFKTQRFGQAPHSPKNCLPGAGWQPLEDRRIPLSVPGQAAPIVVNQYIISHGDQQSVVLYWYQSHGRVIARELEAKFWLVADAIRYHRSDTALVRVMVPVAGDARDSAEATATEFARSVYPDILRQLPN